MKFINKLLILILVFIIIITLMKSNKNINDFIHNDVLGNNMNFISIKKYYNKYFGKIIPLDNIIKTKMVFNEKISYSNICEYDDYIIVSTDESLIPSIEEGIVVFIGNKDEFNNVVIIDGEHTIWYGNINPLVKLYDRVNTGEYIGEASDNKLYLLFKKDGKIIDYKGLI